MNRLDRFFDSGNPVMKFLSILVDLAILNVMTVICAIPLVTAGGALAAMNYVMLHLLRRDETYVTQMFRSSFKENFRQGIPEGLAVILVIFITAVDLWALHGLESKLLTVMMIAITAIAAFILAASVYMFALQARYENTVKGTMANALRLAVANLPRTGGMMVTWMLWVLALVYLHKAAPLAFLLYGFTLPGYICTILYDKVLADLEKDE